MVRQMIRCWNIHSRTPFATSEHDVCPAEVVKKSGALMTDKRDENVILFVAYQCNISAELLNSQWACHTLIGIHIVDLNTHDIIMFQQLGNVIALSIIGGNNANILLILEQFSSHFHNDIAFLDVLQMISVEQYKNNQNAHIKTGII
jgi:hypothetical protein